MRTIKPAIQTIIISFSLFVFLFGVALAAPDPLTTEGLRTSISILTKARDSIASRGIKTLHAGAEKQDLLVFVSYLDGRIYYYCEQLADIGGPPALQETVCPKNPDGTLQTSQFAAIPKDRSQTSEEKLTALDSSFNESLGSFDEMLLKEQQKVASHAPRQQGGGSQSGTDRFESQSGANAQQGTGENVSNSGYPDTSELPGNKPGTRSQPATSGAGSNSGAGTGSTRASQTPPTAGNKDLSQTDDDIIAKQLKEAAEQESDPEVKAKLWDEYRKYKEGIR